MALECKSHRHLSTSEARRLLATGDICRFDDHPVTLLPRYVSRTYDRPRPPLGEHVIRCAAGAWNTDPSEVQWARSKVTELAPSRAEIRVGDWVVLSRIFFDNHNFVFSESPSAGGMHNVEIRFHSRTPETISAVNGYRKWFRGADFREPTAMFQSKIRKWRQDLGSLDIQWKFIVRDYKAGRWSDELKNCRASDMPSNFLREILNSYSL
jgi:hypothetical protein